jgi:hypothetical protein
MNRIARLRRLARRWLGRRVEVELFNDRDFEGRIVRVTPRYLVLRRRRRGIIVRIRIFFRAIEEIKLED